MFAGQILMKVGFCEFNHHSCIFFYQWAENWCFEWLNSTVGRSNPFYCFWLNDPPSLVRSLDAPLHGRLHQLRQLRLLAKLRHYAEGLRVFQKFEGLVPMLSQKSLWSLPDRDNWDGGWQGGFLKGCWRVSMSFPKIHDLGTLKVVWETRCCHLAIKRGHGNPLFRSMIFLSKRPFSSGISQPCSLTRG